MPACGELVVQLWVNLRASLLVAFKEAAVRDSPTPAAVAAAYLKDHHAYLFLSVSPAGHFQRGSNDLVFQLHPCRLEAPCLNGPLGPPCLLTSPTT